MEKRTIRQRIQQLHRQAAAPADWSKKWYNDFSHALVVYDKKQSMREIKRNLPENIYRTGHLLEALSLVKKEMDAKGEGATLDDLKKALNDNFYVNQIAPLKALMKKYEIL